MATTTPPMSPRTIDQTPPKPTDPPLLLAILIGAMKTGDKLLKSLAHEWLTDQGIHVKFAKDAPVLRPREVSRG